MDNFAPNVIYPFRCLLNERCFARKSYFLLANLLICSRMILLSPVRFIEEVKERRRVHTLGECHHELSSFVQKRSASPFEGRIQNGIYRRIFGWVKTRVF